MVAGDCDSSGVANCTRWANATGAKAHDRAVRPQTILMVFTTFPFSAWRGREGMRLTDEDAFNTKGHSPGQGRFVGTYAHVPFLRLPGESGRFRLLVAVGDRSLESIMEQGDE